MILPYVRDDEVWAIGRVHDEDAAVAMLHSHISTSPAVGFDPKDVLTTETGDGEVLRIEGSPSEVNHLAVVANGVWDKGGDPVGIDTGDGPMTVKDAEDQARKDAEEAERKKAEEEDDKARADAGETEEERDARKDKARKDAEEKARADATPPAWADALIKRMDALENKGGDQMPPRADGETEEERKKRESEGGHEANEERDRKEREAKADKARKDAEARADAAEKSARADRARLAAIEAQIAAMQKEPDPDDAQEIAKTQMRADSLGRALNISAVETRPIDGEGAISYRRRMAAKFQRFARSDDAKLADVRKIDVSALPLVERVIYADAQAAANDPGMVGEGGNLYYEKKEMLGRVVEIPHGDPAVFIGRHTMAGYRQRGGVRTNIGK